LILKAIIRRFKSAKNEVIKSVILVNRQEGGLDNNQQHVADVSPIITRDELMVRWQELNGMTNEEWWNRYALSIL
jgi:orotate phosphoribosyltransferase